LNLLRVFVLSYFLYCCLVVLSKQFAICKVQASMQLQFVNCNFK
jgi:hypothetical protein